MEKEIKIYNEYGEADGYVTRLDSEEFFNYLNNHLDEELVLEVKRYLAETNCKYFAVLKDLVVSSDERGKGHGTKLLKTFMAEAKRLPIILICDNLNSQLEGFVLEDWYLSHDFEYTPFKTISGPILIKF